MNKRFNTRLILLALFFLLNGVVAMAQDDNSIKGFVYEESTGEPMMFTNVYLKGTTYGGSTNENGYFNINRIPDGRYTLLVTSVGYDTISEVFNLSKNQTVSRKYYMKETSQKLETVTITADKIESDYKGFYTLTDVEFHLYEQCLSINGSFKCNGLEYKVTGSLFPAQSN